MGTIFKFGLFFSILVLVISGCSGTGGLSTPALPDESSVLSTSNNDNNRYLWAYHLIYVDPAENELNIVPVRDAADHWNVLNFLEQWPCTDCIKIGGFEQSDYGTLLVDVEIKHPFDNLNLTAFDVRGIAIFDASYTYPVSGLTVSNSSLGDGELINPEGYTTLYNSTTMGSGPNGIQGYLQGKMATLQPPNSMLNGYKRFVTEQPGAWRNALYAGDTVTMTYEIDMPDGEFVFGYAVDANWAPPINTPVIEPEDDFGPEANCPEPWKINVSGAGIGESGETLLNLEIYDWQGSTTYSEPVIECPELFDGTVTATWVGDHWWGSSSFYEVNIINENNAPLGTYRCLVSVEDEENASSPDWLDLTGYALHTIEVHSMDIVDITPPWLNYTASDVVVDGNYAYVAGGVNGLHILDISDPNNPLWLHQVDVQGSADEVAISGNYSYVADYKVGLYIIDISIPESAYIYNQIDLPNGALIVELQGGYAYTLGLDYILHVIDIDPPEDAQVVHTVESPDLLFTELAVSGGYAYASGLNNGDEWFSGFVFIDISDPESAFIENWIELTAHAYDIYVDGSYAYIVTVPGGLLIADIDPPEYASIINTIEISGYCNSVSVSGSYAYVSNQVEFYVIDIDTPESASIIGSMESDGWVQNIYIQGEYAYIANWEYGLQIAKIDPPESPYIVSHTRPISSLDHLALQDGYVYIPSQYMGLQIVDVDPPELANIACTVDIPGRAHDIAVSGQCAFVTDRDNGLHVIDINPPESAHIIHTVDLTISAKRLMISNGYAYISASNSSFNGSFYIVDIDPPESAQLINSIDAYGFSEGIDVSGEYAYLMGWKGLQIIDIDPPESAWIVNSISSSGDSHGRGIEVHDGYAYTTSEDTLKIYDIDPPESMFVFNEMSTPSWANGVTIYNGHAWVGCGYVGGLLLVDIEPVGSAHIVSSFDTPGSAHDVVLDGDIAYVADSHGGLRILQLQ